MLIIAFGLLFFIVNPIITMTSSGLSSAGLDNPISAKVLQDYLNMKSFIYTSFYVLISLLVALSWITSFVDRSNMFGYIANAVGILIITPICIFIAASIWQNVAVLGISTAELNLAFITNWSTIMIVNLIFGLLSFLFVNKGVQQ